MTDALSPQAVIVDEAPEPTRSFLGGLTSRFGVSGWLFYGTITAGVAAYSYQVLAGRILGPERYASLSALWTLAFLIGPACFAPVEQEVSRSVSSLIARQLGARPTAVRHAKIGLLIAFLAAIVMAVTGPDLLHRAFDGQWLLLVSLVMALAGYYCMHLTWGLLAGAGHMRGYGIVTSTEGIVRLLLAVLIALVGVHRAGPFGLAIGIAPFVAAFAGWRVDRVPLVDGPAEPWSPAARAVGALVVGSLFSLVLLSIAPLAVKLLANQSEQAAAGSFQAGLALTRAPLFLFNALLVALIPSLSVAATEGRWHDFARMVKRITAVVTVVMVVVTVGAGVLGPAVIRGVFGKGFAVSAGDLSLMGVACTCYMASSVLACALIALQCNGRRTVCTGAGCCVFLLVIVLGGPLGLLGRVAWGFAIGTAVMATSCAVVCWLALRRRLFAVN